MRKVRSNPYTLSTTTLVPVFSVCSDIRVMSPEEAPLLRGSSDAALSATDRFGTQSPPDNSVEPVHINSVPYRQKKLETCSRSARSPAGRHPAERPLAVGEHVRRHAHASPCRWRGGAAFRPRARRDTISRKSHACVVRLTCSTARRLPLPGAAEQRAARAAAAYSPTLPPVSRPALLLQGSALRGSRSSRPDGSPAPCSRNALIPSTRGGRR